MPCHFLLQCLLILPTSAAEQSLKTTEVGHLMNNKAYTITDLLMALTQGDMMLFREVALEMKDLLIDESEGCWQVKTDEALRLGFELDRRVPKEALPSPKETHRLLLNQGSNQQLLNNLFPQ